MTLTKKSRTLIYAAIILVGGFVVLNFSYLVKMVNFYISPPNPQIQSEEVSVFIEPNRLFIPSLDIESPIIYVEDDRESTFQQALQSGVVHFPSTAIPGQYGNPYIFGHSSDYSFSKGDYKTVFALLPKIEIGAKIIISDPAGERFEYKVIKSYVTDAKDLSVLDQGNYEEKLLTLQTSYPIGTALRRWIVVAKIVE